MTSVVHARQPLETETARLLPRGIFKLEYWNIRWSIRLHRKGKETAVPIVFEYGLSNKLEILFEPVVYTSISPNAGSHATGFGDMELTISYLLKNETSNLPAFAIAGEVKIPTAKDTLIEPGKLTMPPILLQANISESRIFMAICHTRLSVIQRESS